MFFFYTIRELVLAEKIISTTLKKEDSARTCTLRIITTSVSFLGLPLGGGLLKLSRLYDENGKLIHARKYSPELKAEVKALKQTCQIPYFKLWWGYLFILTVVLVAAVIFNTKNKMANAALEDRANHLKESLQQVQTDKIYGASFFVDAQGNRLPALADGWVRIKGVEGDTLFVQRSKQLAATKTLFDLDDLAAIKPVQEADWEEKVEKVNYGLLKEQLQEAGRQSVDVLYIGADSEQYSGVIFTFKAVE